MPGKIQENHWQTSRAREGLLKKKMLEVLEVL
jgi:hypothetical protein